MFPLSLILGFTINSVPWWGWLLVVITIVAFRDIVINRKHTISHNFPVVGHLRYLLEKIGPELRQYIVANNREELPFNRSERSWIYASAKEENNYQGFGTDQDIHAPGYHFIKPNVFPFQIPDDHPNMHQKDFVPCAKVMGEFNKRKRPYRPQSVLNISAMSFGSLSAAAIEALNIGAHKAHCYHNSGEGGLSPYHDKGADLIFQIGTGYFGVRNPDGSFSMNKLVELVEQHPNIRAIEVKLSQGAKPGKGGVLPASKITHEIARIRHVEMGKDVISPSFHSAFSGIDGLLDFIEEISTRTGLPVGIKSAIGRTEQWEYMADKMIQRGSGPDFITIDGGEGGTGAAPPSFANHVSLPFFYAFSTVYKVFQAKGICNRIVWIASGKLGLPAPAAKAFAMGADVINVAREAMMSIGCIQAQVCHTNRCPAGVATQNKWLQSGLDVPLKSDRVAHYVKAFRKELLELAMATGHEHPCEFTMTDIEISMGDSNYTTTLKDCFEYEKDRVHYEGTAPLAVCPHLGGQQPVNYEYQ
ncbi:MAG: FMN-binding glutamate synthase family protein [Flavobacteriales bacterium]|nr:FMN-binding glutamate synthase family protein [Bacteroidota bacterium]MCB9240489.1 FMN-binding glutamate synthase family protein [Flavobacteriales bacterium]